MQLLARNTEMAIHQTPSQRKTVERVMHEFKHGALKTARGRRKSKTQGRRSRSRSARPAPRNTTAPRNGGTICAAQKQRSAAAKPVRPQPKDAGAAHRAGLGTARRGTSFIGKPDSAIFRGAPR